MESMLPVKGNILIVDDNRDDLRLLATLLTARGHLVRPALDGAAALAAITIEPPDLILLDVQMPGMDGYTICRRLKAHEYTAAIPVIFISARNEVLDKVQAFAAGGVDYISKPFQAEEIVARVEIQLRLYTLYHYLEAQNRLLQQEVAERRHIEAELQRHHDQLEELVAARTIELREANAHLHMEVAERKRAEEALSLTRFTVERVADALYWIDPDARFVDVNDAACRMLGYTRVELLTMSVFDIDPAFSPERWRSSWQQLTEMGSLTLESVHRTSDGRIIPVDLVANLISFGGRMLNCAFARDITERKRAEEARRAQEQAEAASHAKSSFLAYISHELRTPLNSMLGYAHILQRRATDTSLRESLAAIQQSGEHLLTMINDMLDLAKIEAGRVELRVADTHLPSLINSMLGILRSRATAGDLQLTCVIPPFLPPVVQVDEQRLRQVLLNLLSNAVKFTEQGTVSLTVELLDQNCSASEYPMAHLRFSVTDTGIGIAPDQLELIFEPFERAGAADRRGEGTGLGLAISRQLVALMGGQLQVQSRLGQGSRFWFELNLPISPLSRPTMMAGIPEIVGYQGRRRTVLVVDDQPDNRMVLRELLEPLGFVVRTASDGQQAVDQALAWQPDVILMDIVMPVKSGLVATEELRTHGQQGVIIAISASAMDHDIQQTLQAGCNAFFPKPVDADALLTMLADRLALEWVYAETTAQSPGTGAAPGAAVVLPGRADLEALYSLAQRGNLIALASQARQMATRNPHYNAFATQISELSRAYEDRRVRLVLKEYLEMVS